MHLAQCSCGPRSVQDDLVGADKAEDVAGLAVEKIQVKICVRQTPGLVFQRRDVRRQPVTLALEGDEFGFYLYAAKQGRNRPARWRT